MTPPQEQTVAAFAYRVVVGAAIVIGLVLLAWGLGHAVQALLLTFAGVLLAVFLRTLSQWVKAHTPLSEAWALAVAIVAVLTFVAVVVAVSAPSIGEQAARLREQLPEAVTALAQWVERQPWSGWLPTIEGSADDEGGLGKLLGTATGIAASALHAFLSLFIVLFAALYLAIDPRLYTNGVLHLVPFRHRPRAAAILEAIGLTLRSWLFGTLIRMLAVGLLTLLGLWALGMPLALILAALAGLLEFVPYFGPVIAAIPAILVAFAEGPELATYVLAFYVVLQQAESLVISPLVYQRTVYLPPVLTLLGQIIFFSMAGILGGVLATPLVAVALVLTQMLYLEQTLGDEGVTLGHNGAEGSLRPPE